MHPLERTTGAVAVTRALTTLWRGYWTLIAGLTILCCVTAALWWAAAMLGYPLP